MDPLAAFHIDRDLTQDDEALETSEQTELRSSAEAIRTDDAVDRSVQRTSNGARRKSSAGLRSKKFAGRSSKRIFFIDMTGQSSDWVTW
jgi:hypothetical protein